MITRYASRPAMIVAPRVVLRALLRLVCAAAAGVSLAPAFASPRGLLLPLPHSNFLKCGSKTTANRGCPILRTALFRAEGGRPQMYMPPDFIPMGEREADQHSGMAGTYEGQAPAADAAKRRFTLLLAADGTAVLTTFYIEKNSTTERGRWTQNGEELVLTFNPLGPHQPPSPIAFRYRRGTLWPIRWNQSEWGRAGPPVLHRSRHPAGSTKNSL